MLKDPKAGTGQEQDEGPQAICQHFTRTLGKIPQRQRLKQELSGESNESFMHGVVTWSRGGTHVVTCWVHLKRQIDGEHGTKDRNILETDLNRFWWRRHWSVGMQGHMSQLRDPIRAHQAERSPALFKEKLVWIQELWEMGYGLKS